MHDPARHRSPEPTGPPDPERSEGGDPVCWLDRVCDACGALAEGPPAAVCERCGAPQDARA